MSINASSPFGARSAQAPAARRPFGAKTEEAAERPKAEYWLNIGYVSSAPDEEEEGKEREIFVSLSTGIPLDQAEVYDVTKARSSNMAVLRQAQNELLEGFLSRAKELQPGESAVVSYDEATGLSMEIKRVRGPQAVPTENTLKRSFSFR